MDRRQRKTRQAIFQAFSRLLAVKSYDFITVQEIIDAADVGRTTFYAHFRTKEALLKAVCEELFGHVIQAAVDPAHLHGGSATADGADPAMLHLLLHLAENDRQILRLLTCDSSPIFLRYFKKSLRDSLAVRLLKRHPLRGQVPDEFLLNFIVASLVDMVSWWIEGGLTQPPASLAVWYQALLVGGASPRKLPN